MNSSVTFLVLRGFLYAMFVAGLVYLVTLEGYRDGKDSVYSEQSLTEWLESGYALLSGLVFIAVARLSATLRPVAVMLAALCLMMFIREGDFFLDRIFDGAWQVLVTLVLITTVLYLWRQPHSIANSIREFARLPSAGILLSGFLVLFVFSRLFGRGSFWQSVMGDDYVRVVKNIAEEGTEIMGYGLIAIAAIELLVFAISAVRARIHTPG